MESTGGVRPVRADSETIPGGALNPLRADAFHPTIPSKSDSGIGLMDRTQESDPGIGFRDRIQESDSGIGFRDRIQESASGIGFR